MTRKIKFFNGLFKCLCLIAVILILTRFFLSPNDFILVGMALPTHKTTMTIVNPTSSKVIATNSTTMPIANMRSQTVLPAASKVIATNSVAKLPQIILSSHTITNTTGTLSETILRAKTTLNHKVSYAQPVSSKIIRGIDPPG